MRIVLICLPFLLFACSSTKGNLNYQEKVKAELGNDAERLESPAGKYTLFFSREPKSEGQELVNFMVLDNAREELVFQEALLNAKLSWHSDSLLLVEQQTGILQGDAAMNNGIQQYLLNPENGKKKPLPQNTNTK